MHLLPGIILLYLAVPFITLNVFCTRYHTFNTERTINKIRLNFYTYKILLLLILLLGCTFDTPNNNNNQLITYSYTHSGIYNSVKLYSAYVLSKLVCHLGS